MIIDKLHNWELYNSSSQWKRIFDFLIQLDETTEEKKYEIQGEDIFALVMSYNTQQPDVAKLEAHQEYVDIQTVLIGAEGIEWFVKDMLHIETAYNQDTDVEFYIRPFPSPTRVDVFPGMFVLLFPHDAHMPTLMVGEKSEYIKKVVVKVKMSLFKNGLISD